MQGALQSTLTGCGYEVLAHDRADVALNTLCAGRIDAGLISWDLPDSTGPWLLAECRRVALDVPLAVFSGNYTSAAIRAAVDSGAFGYITRRATPVEVSQKVSELLKGTKDVYDTAASLLLLSSLRPTSPSRQRLSRRELEVLKLVAEGNFAPQIGSILHLSPHTVKDVLRQCFKKLGVHDRAAAVACGFRSGYLC